MTVTDQVVSTADCRPCGHARFSHRQGVGGCKLCTCEGYEPDTAASAKPELERLRAQVEQLERAVSVITADRDEARREANEAANKNARLRVERDAARAEVAELVEDRTHLAVEVANLRRVNVKLGRAEAVEVGNELAKVRRERDIALDDRDQARSERDQNAADLQAVADTNDKLRRQLADAEAALVEANTARRMRDSDHLHERIGAAALVISREQAGMCLRCRDLGPFVDAGHGCGPLTPVDVIIARRPNPPTTEEQP